MTATPLLLRLTPVMPTSRRFLHVVHRNAMAYRHLWFLFFSGFFEPLLYLLSIGVGVGKLVGTVSVGGRALDYADFVAPGMMAASAMNGAVFDSTINVFVKLKYHGVYGAMLATPLSANDVAIGEIGWSLLRGETYATTFLVVMVLLGRVHSWWGVLMIPTAGLIGLAFAAIGMAGASLMRSHHDFDFVNVVTLPLFLFSATFYPLSVYPRPLQLVVQCTPLYHGAALMRSLAFGDVHAGVLAHVAYLLVLGLVGAAIASRRFERLLLT